MNAPWKPWAWLVSLAILISCTSAYAPLNDENLLNLPWPAADFDIKTGSLLAPILKPRVPGTPGSLEVLQHFVDFWKTSLPDWRVELQNSTSTTPTSDGKEVPFVNLIASRDPPGALPGQTGRLTLVAHYDSLQKPEGFIGAIDSAAPCAMLMQVARSVDGALTKKWSEKRNTHDLDSLDADDNHKGVQVILLDGEEAFLHWTATDSVYGARALADAWENTLHPAGSPYHNNLTSIDLFVLLDLLGAKNSQIPSYFLTTHWAYQSLAKIEQRLRDLKHFQSSSTKTFLPDHDKTASQFRPSLMGDDHVPFMQRGVEILHMIPSQFPSVWHTIYDDGEHLDMAAVEDWTRIFTAFTAEYMELDRYMGPSSTKRSDKEEL